MTIAYSDKYQTWVSRYSFEPTCYSTIGNSLVSFNDDGGVWSHDTNDSRCSFYGEQEGASIQVCSNQDPSAVKMFKSISLETNGTGWFGKVYTNDEYDGNERQEGDILASFFKNKEGFKYAEMPRSRINSSVVFPGGRTKTIPVIGSDTNIFNTYLSDTLIEAQTSSYVIQDPSVPNSISLVQILPGSNIIVPASETIMEFNLEVSKLSDLIGSGSNPAYIGDDGNLVVMDKIMIAGAGNNYITLQANPNDFGMEQMGGTIIHFELVAYLMSGFYEIFAAPGQAAYAHVGSEFYSVSSSEINGDQMRGPYSRIELNTSTDKPFELHAINVDYEFSKLDKRLTQNS
jgi:hypothetical protein